MESELGLSIVNWNAKHLANPASKEKFSSLLTPPGIRRRCSQVTQYALEAALELHQFQPPDYSVFCSRHGEIDHSLQLLDSISRRETLSPIAFSQSVHNAAAGIYSIISNNTAPSASIAAGKNSLLMGLLDCWAFLKQNSEKKAMLIYSEQELPQFFQRAIPERSMNLSLGFLLTSVHDPKSETSFLFKSGPESENQGWSFLEGFRARGCPSIVAFGPRVSNEN